MEVPASQLAFGYRKTDLMVRFLFSDVLYLDALTKTYVEEFSAANFFGIRDHTFMTPDSPSVLASITNACVRQIAADTGLKVERRPIPVAELPEFDELGALGTAAVITPIGRIVFGDVTYVYGEGSQAGPYTTELYDRLVAIQAGRAEDVHGWCELIDDPPFEDSVA